MVTTNQRTITVAPNDYTVLKLNNGEMVTQYAMQMNKQVVACTPDPTNRVTLLNNPNLTAGEFIPNAQSSNACEFIEISRMQRDGGLSRDIYGFYPTQHCYQLPTMTYSGN